MFASSSFMAETLGSDDIWASGPKRKEGKVASNAKSEVSKMLVKPVGTKPGVGRKQANRQSKRRSSSDAITESEYARLLKAPMTSLVGIHHGRPDVMFAAILGYN